MMKKGWEHKELGEVAVFSQGIQVDVNLQTEKCSPGKVRFLRIIDVTQGNVPPRYIDDPGEKYYLKADEIAMVRYGTIGFVCYGIEGVIANNLFKISIKDKSKLQSNYLQYFLKSDLFQSHIRKSVGGAALPSIKFGDIKHIMLGIPPLSEQKEIVKYLDSSFAKIDTLKANAAKNLDEAKALFQSALKETFEPKDNWEEKTLGEVGNFKRGGNFSKKDFIENGFPCIHYGQIHMKFGIETFKHLSSVPVEMVKPDRCAQKGDLIIAITSEDDAGSCKCTAWMGDYEVYIGGHTAIYHHSMEPKFVSYYFMSPYFQKAKLEYTHGFKVVEINPKDIAKISVHIPPLSEQQEIVSRLDSLNEKLNTLQQNYSRICSECDALKQSILRQVFE